MNAMETGWWGVDNLWSALLPIFVLSPREPSGGELGWGRSTWFERTSRGVGIA